MSHQKVALSIATVLLIVLAGCGGSSGSTATPTSTPTERVDSPGPTPPNLDGVNDLEEFSFPDGVTATEANVDADRLQRRHVGHLQDANSYVVRSSIRVDRGQDVDVQTATKRHEDGVGTLTEVRTETFVSEVWRPAESDAVLLKQGDSVTYVGPNLDPQLRETAIREQSVGLFVDQLARRDLRTIRGTTVRGTDAVDVAGNASVVPGTELQESSPVRDVRVNGTLTAESLIESAQVEYVRPRAADEPTVTRTYQVVSLDEGMTEPEWIYDAPRVDAELVNERVIRLRNTGARPIPTGSRVFVQLEDTVLRVELPVAIPPRERVELYRPIQESDSGQSSGETPPLRVSTGSVEFDELAPFGDEVTVVVRVGDDVARVKAS